MQRSTTVALVATVLVVVMVVLWEPGHMAVTAVFKGAVAADEIKSERLVHPCERDPNSWACACAGATAKQPLLKEACRIMPAYRGVFVMGLTSAGNQNLTMNWLISLQRVGFDPRLVVLLCADSSSAEYFRARGLTVLQLTAQVWSEVSDVVGWQLQAPPQSDRSFVIYSEPYLALVKNRLAFVTYLLINGATVLFHDTDIAYLKRSRHGIDRAIDLLSQQPNKTMLMMYNRSPEEWIEYNMGYFLVRPSAESITIFSVLNTYMFDQRMEESKMDDQNLFNEYVLGNRYNRDAVHLRRFVSGLPYEEFVPGRTTFANRVWPPNDGPYWPMIQAGWPSEMDAATPAVIHANWCLDYEKIPRMQVFKIFWAHEPKEVAAAGLNVKEQPRKTPKRKGQKPTAAGAVVA